VTYSRLIGASVLAVGLAFGFSAMAADTSGMATPTGSKISPAIWHQMDAVQKTDLMKAQRKLKQDGVYRGPIDGKGGPKTIMAIQKFQKSNGLKPTGWLDKPTWDKLGIHPTMATAAGTTK